MLHMDRSGCQKAANWQLPRLVTGKLAACGKWQLAAAAATAVPAEATCWPFWPLSHRIDALVAAWACLICTSCCRCCCCRLNLADKFVKCQFCVKSASKVGQAKQPRSASLSPSLSPSLTAIKIFSACCEVPTVRNIKYDTWVISKGHKQS